MCASYGTLSSTFVSTRCTVPDTLASAAARTLAATSPVRSFSVFPLTVCPPSDGLDGGAPPCVLAGGAVDDGVDVVPDVAAFAIAPPPTAAAPTAAAGARLGPKLGQSPPRVGC